jgi:hypothetical protein
MAMPKTNLNGMIMFLALLTWHWGFLFAPSTLLDAEKALPQS